MELQSARVILKSRRGTNKAARLEHSVVRVHPLFGCVFALSQIELQASALI